MLLGILKNESINIGKLDKIEFMSASHPPTDKSFPFQLLSLLLNLSSIWPQFVLVILTWLIGIPKYLKGKVPYLQPNTCI